MEKSTPVSAYSYFRLHHIQDLTRHRIRPQVIGLEMQNARSRQETPREMYKLTMLMQTEDNDIYSVNTQMDSFGIISAASGISFSNSGAGSDVFYAVKTFAVSSGGAGYIADNSAGLDPNGELN